MSRESAAGLRAAQRSVYRSDLRKQLLSTTKHRVADTSGNNSDFTHKFFWFKFAEDETFRKNERLEENLANDLLSMTRSLKTVMTAANDVIKEDNKKLTKMQKQVEDNKSALEVTMLLTK